MVEKKKERVEGGLAHVQSLMGKTSSAITASSNDLNKEKVIKTPPF